MLSPIITALACSNQSTNSESVEPEVSYSCIDLDQAPWMSAYDINQDGYFGEDDLGACIYPSPSKKIPSLFHASSTVISQECATAKIGMLSEEVEWNLKELIAVFFADDIDAEKVQRFITHFEQLEQDAFRRLDGLSTAIERPVATASTRAEITEMFIRARNVVQYNADEPFGAGITFVLDDSSDVSWTLRVTGTHTASDAMLKGIQRGDVIVQVNGKGIKSLSSDGTLAGIEDPNTGMVRGFSGPRGSELSLTILRDGEPICVKVVRNIWSARTLGVEDTNPRWNGTPN